MKLHFVHRGLIVKYSIENTIDAFKKSLRLGYGIETDLQVTKDQKIICFHDQTLKRILGSKKKINETNLHEINSLAKKKNIKIQKFKELLKIYRKTPIIAELKSNFSKEQIYKLVELCKRIKKLVLISFQYKNLEKIYALNKKLTLGQLFYKKINKSLFEKVKKKKFIKFCIFEKQSLNNPLVKQIKKKKLFYTIKDKKTFLEFKNKEGLIFEYTAL